MRNSPLIQFISHKYDLIAFIHMGSSLLSFPSLLCRQFDLRVRCMGESTSRQDHLNFYKWLYSEFIAPILEILPKICFCIPYLGNFSAINGQMAR